MAGKDGVEEKKFPPPTNSYRPRCFFDIQINKVEAGRIIFELFPDICPKTCENFRALSTGEKGEGKTTSKPLHFKNSILHRIVKNFIIQGGDFTAGDGTGGESIYGGTFKDENFELKHDRPFLLSMANCGTNTNGSQFFITLAAAPHLDNVHTVFGHVLFGQEIVRDMENQKVNANHKPYADIRISHCGELIKKTKAVNKKTAKSDEKVSSSESSSSSDSDSNHHRKKRKRKKSKERKKSIVRDKDRGKEFSNINTNEEKPKEPLDGDLNFIPTVPSTFLMRRSRTPTPVRERRRKEGVNDSRKREPVLRTRVNMVSKSGKKLRGRGVMRYRTPTPDSSTEGDSDDDAPPLATDGDQANEKDQRKASEFQKTESVIKKDEKIIERPHISRSNEKQKVPARSRERNRSRSRSRSRSRERRRPKPRSHVGRRSRSRDRRRSRSRSRSRSAGRYRRRSRSFERRRSRYNRRSRSRSRRRSPRYRSRSPDRRRSPRNTSHERKGKFERHRSKSGSRSDSSQERKKKSLKDREKKVEKPLTDKSSIKEKIDKLIQKKEEENKASLVTSLSAETFVKADDEIDNSLSVIDKSCPLNINEVSDGKEVSAIHQLIVQNGKSSVDFENSTGSQKLPSPSPPPSQPSTEKPIDDHLQSELKESLLSKEGKVLPFPTGIDEKSSLVQRNICSDDYIATSIEEENISGYLFETKDRIEPINKNDSKFKETAFLDSGLPDKNRNVEVKMIKKGNDKSDKVVQGHQSIDEIIRSKGKIDELQEQIREFKEYKQQFSEKIDFTAILNNHKKKAENGLSDKEGNSKVSKIPKVKKDGKVDSDSHSDSDDGRKASEKKMLKKFSKHHSYSENGKNDNNDDDDDDNDDDESDDGKKIVKKKSKKRKDHSSSDYSDVDHRKKKDRRKHESRKSRKRRRNVRSSSSSRSDSDSEAENKVDSHHSEKATDADEESTVEADRDRKKNKKGKHKRKRTATDRSHNSDGEDNVSKHRKQKHRVKRHDTDYSSDDSKEDRKRRSKRRRKKKHVSESSSEDSSEDEYEHSRKRKLKSYDKKRDRKRKKKRNSIST